MTNTKQIPLFLVCVCVCALFISLIIFSLLVLIIMGGFERGRVKEEVKNIKLGGKGGEENVGGVERENIKYIA